MDLKKGHWSFFDRTKDNFAGADDAVPNIANEGGKKKWDLLEIGVPKLILIVLAGIILLVCSIPQKNQTTGHKANQSTGQASDKITTEEQIACQAMKQYIQEKEDELEQLLSRIDGVGKTNVMLTLASSEERITLQNDVLSEESTVGGSDGKTTEKQSITSDSVLIQKDGEQQPFLVQIISPEVEGVVVVAQGADGSEVDTQIIGALQALFPIEAHKIRVMKMK